MSGTIDRPIGSAHPDKGDGQIPICTAGEGWYQEEGREAKELKAVQVENTGREYR